DMEQRFNKHITGFYPNGFTSKAKDWVIFMRIDCETMAQARSIVFTTSDRRKAIAVGIRYLMT
ncbi:MAG: hypothetical protein IT240_10605, partial [Bacteroidia bacterium]|nr:hypothetical protein [Bacteroidia bacterium]